MKVLLAAVNAKYIHSNLGIYSLKRYAEESLKQRDARRPAIRIELGEYTINQTEESILQDIYRRRPDVVGFSCYIWNIVYIKSLVRDLKKVLPKTRIWLGGPEVSYNSREILETLPEAQLVMRGEGEGAFAGLLAAERGDDAGKSGGEAGEDGAGTEQGEKPIRLSSRLPDIPGIAWRDGEGNITVNGPAPLLNLDELPFPYESLEGFENRILYYESSRGCPFSCSYCLSSIDKTVRFRNISLVKEELSFFLNHRVSQVKFVDRTFNCKKSHALAIWRFISENDNGITNFHFEIAADLLDKEMLSVLREMRPGLIQLEIGVQTTNPDTIREIRRRTDLKRLAENVSSIHTFQNIHQHLDLIAGLPFEDLERFKKSFNDVYRMQPEQLQLGFLKVLKGSAMEERASRYGLVFCFRPPYEVLATRWLDYGDVLLLKGVEEMLEVYYNSGQFENTMRALSGEFEDPFSMYESLSAWYEREGLSGVSHSRLARYEILFRFIGAHVTDSHRREEYRDRLAEDLYLRENVKSRPSFLRDQTPYKEIVRAFFKKEAESPRYLAGYEGYTARQIIKMAHMEILGDGAALLFDYKNRDARFGNAAVTYFEGMGKQV